MTLAGWLLPPAIPPWSSGSTRETVGGTILEAPAPTETQVGELMQELRTAGRRLAEHPVARIAEVLGRVGERLAAEGDPLRVRALEELPGSAGISRPQAAHVLDGMARDWSREGLRRLLAAEFPDPAVLDAFQAAPLPGEPRRHLWAVPLAAAGRPALHICAGTVPGVSATSLLRGLLVKGPVLLKPGAGDVLLPLLVLQGVHEDDDPAAQALAQAAAVAWWPGGDGGALERVALEGAGALVVYGDDATVEALRGRVGAGVPVVSYPHRISFAVLGDHDPVASGRALARAVAAYDQRGCVSPQQAFVVGTAEGAVAVAEAVAAGLDTLDRTLPPGPATADEAASVQQLRGTAELRAAAGEGVHLLTGPETRWTVVVDPDPTVRPSCLSRTVHVTPVADVGALRRVLTPVAPHLQSIGVSGLAPDIEAAVATAATTLGASRVAPLDAMAFPGLGWRHDGQGPLQRLVRWSTWEASPGGGG